VVAGLILSYHMLLAQRSCSQIFIAISSQFSSEKASQSASSFRMPSQLRANVHVSPGLRVAGAPPGEYGHWSPISCTLIQGEREAVLVDTPISEEQTTELIKWIEETAPSKELTYIYITHGHGDHFFGISLIKERWPNARAVASAGSVEHAETQLGPQWWDGLWNKYFPDQIHLPVELRCLVRS
jgi:glyoxylase-like metal-dependent hydrolase (beta-lactamase superfamily II)